MSTENAPEIDILQGDPVALAVFSRWMECGESSTVPTIAKTLGLSESTIHARIRAAGGCPIGCDVFERDHSLRGSRTRYAPDKPTLRAVIQGLRARNGALHRKAYPELHLSERDAAELHTN